MTNAVLLRNVPLVLRDVSSGGCSFETRTPLQIGMVGWLEVELEGERRFEWFRVTRVHPGGEGLFLAGVEFLPLSAAGSDSLRSVVGRLRRWSAEASAESAGRSSVDFANSDDVNADAAMEFRAKIANSTGKIIKFFRRR